MGITMRLKLKDTTVECEAKCARCGRIFTTAEPRVIKGFQEIINWTPRQDVCGECEVKK